MINLKQETYDTPRRIVRITCIFWLTAKLITAMLWLADRLHPLVPPFDSLSYIPGPIRLSLFIVSLICLIILVAKPTTTHRLIVLFFAEILSGLLDQTWWQPWEYQYLFTILIFIFLKNRPGLILRNSSFYAQPIFIVVYINLVRPFWREFGAERC